jgi:hypothetical protein
MSCGRFPPLQLRSRGRQDSLIRIGLDALNEGVARSLAAAGVCRQGTNRNPAAWGAAGWAGWGITGR